ncbi:DUF1513 domain-containing protein [Enterovibrio sp. 27052020O]|uniref:DUF1513 domain-containing protein n=1 Tax=Enterovibrio sp. 27052020O TaxID=3241166 RepID=UPI00388EB99D
MPSNTEKSARVSQKRRRVMLSALGVMATGSIAGGLTVRGTSTAQSSPAYIGCARQSDGQFAVTAVNNMGEVCYTSPLPERGHGLVVDPLTRFAFVFARRPGAFIRVLSADTGQARSTYHADPNRYFYGHGDVLGNTLFTTEGVLGSSEGVIGVYQILPDGSLKKEREITGFGIGPHEIKVVNGTKLAVAVGGIRTDNRTATNLDTMSPSLVLIDISTQRIVEKHQLPDNQLSIRHLAVSPAQDVVIAQQYQGDPDNISPLLAIRRNNGDFTALKAGTEHWTRFQQYIGSVACTGSQVIATSPRGNCFGIWDLETGELQALSSLMDASGASAQPEGFAISAGTGGVVIQKPRKSITFQTSEVAWDNHWVML